MRLSDLDPHFVDSANGRRGIGVTFRCPCCLDKPASQQETIWVAFENPIDGGQPVKTASGLRWQRAGETFENLTLSPSIDGSSFGHWHGFVTSGEVRNA